MLGGGSPVSVSPLSTVNPTWTAVGSKSGPPLCDADKLIGLWHFQYRNVCSKILQAYLQYSSTLSATLCPKFMPNGWYGGWRRELPPFCLQFCIPLQLPLTYIINQPIVPLAKVITANIPLSRLAVNIGSTTEGEAKTWLGSTQGTVFCVLSTVKLKLWAVRQQRKPSTSNCDFCYWVNGGNSHRHKQLVLRIQMRV